MTSASNSYRTALADRLMKYSFVEAIGGMSSADWKDFQALMQQALRSQCGPGMPSLNPQAAWPFPKRDPRLLSALKTWEEEWGEQARNDSYSAPWDRGLAEAIKESGLFATGSLQGEKK